MASLPGHMVVVGQRVEEGRLVMDIRIRWFHPGAWWMVVPAVWRWVWAGVVYRWRKGVGDEA